MSAEFRPTSNRRNQTNRLTPPSTSSVSSRGKQPVETQAHGIVQARGDARLYPALCGDECARAKTLQELGVAEDRIYTDHGLTGTTRARPGLDQALAAVREGDTLVVPKLDGWQGPSQMPAPSPIGFGNGA